MTKLSQVYKCNVCGNIVEVVHASGGTLSCCDKPVQLMEEKTKDQGLEKHVPVIEKVDGGIKVKVGSVPHPMEEAHWIEWVELIVGDSVYRQYLQPSHVPEAIFKIAVDDISQLAAREYCNLHGLWTS